MTKNFHITGPSSEAAVDSLIDEVTLIEGTHTVDVDTDRGVMIVTGEDFSSQDIEQAAQNAGFALAE